MIDLYQWHRPDRSMLYGEVDRELQHAAGRGQDQGDRHLQRQRRGDRDRRSTCSARAGWPACRTSSRPRLRGSDDELDYCDEHGIAFLPWSPLGGTGGGARSVGERFAVFAEIGARPRRQPAAGGAGLGARWSDHVIPIPGARRPESITDSAKAADLELSQAELARLTDSLDPAPPGRNRSLSSVRALPLAGASARCGSGAGLARDSSDELLPGERLGHQRHGRPRAQAVEEKRRVPLPTVRCHRAEQPHRLTRAAWASTGEVGDDHVRTNRALPFGPLQDRG